MIGKIEFRVEFNRLFPCEVCKKNTKTIRIGEFIFDFMIKMKWRSKKGTIPYRMFFRYLCPLCWRRLMSGRDPYYLKRDGEEVLFWTIPG